MISPIISPEVLAVMKGHSDIVVVDVRDTYAGWLDQQGRDGSPVDLITAERLRPLITTAA